MKKIVQAFAVILIVSFFIACGEPPKPFTERRIVIGNKETVRIPEISLSITNNGCGRKWVGVDQPYEKAYCDLVIKGKDSTITAGDDRDPVYLGNIKIVIDRMNPWGLEEDSVPPGGCRVVVTKLPDNSR